MISLGTTPIKGVGFRSEDYGNTMVVAGPMCKKAEDLEPLLRVLIGDNITKLKLDTPVDLKNLKIFYQVSSGDIRSSLVSKVMRSTLMKALRHLEEITGSATKVINRLGKASF